MLPGHFSTTLLIFLLLLTLSVCVSFGFFYKAPTCSRFLSASFDDARQSLTFLTRRRLSCRQKLQTTRPPRPRQPYLRRPARSRPRSNRLVIVVMRAKSDVMVLRYVLLLLFNHATMENIAFVLFLGRRKIMFASSGNPGVEACRRYLRPPLSYLQLKRPLLTTCSPTQPCNNCQTTSLPCTYLLIPKKKGPKGPSSRTPRAVLKMRMRQEQEQSSASSGQADGISNSTASPPLLSPTLENGMSGLSFSHAFEPSPLLSLEVAQKYVDKFFKHKYGKCIHVC